MLTRMAIASAEVQVGRVPTYPALSQLPPYSLLILCNTKEVDLRLDTKGGVWQGSSLGASSEEHPKSSSSIHF